VDTVGGGVTTLSPGDRVFGMRTGAHAELVRVREAGVIARMPDGWTFEEAAAVCDGAFQALGHLRAGGVGEGTRLLVYGASGSCGTAAVQIGRHLGAHVTAVCGPNALELVRSLGADEVIDYTEEDFTRNGETYEVILDAVGKHSFFRCRRSLAPGGRFVATDRLYNLPLSLVTRLSGRKVVFDMSRPKKADIVVLRSLLEAGEYRAVVDRTYPLEDVVEATRYVDTWQKTGNVVLTLSGGAR
jgi:NADPH:quinone reductase-like Zn-dependent oxidoreductase